MAYSPAHIMTISNVAVTWDHFKKFTSHFQAIGLSVDLSRMHFEPGFFEKMAPKMDAAFVAMAELEAGAISNPDEQRKVGHYWLRNPSRVSDLTIREEITRTLAALKAFAARVQEGQVQGAKGAFKNVLIIGIGGSALGPQFVADALGHPQRDKVKVFFFDNTDPDGFDKVLGAIGNELGQTLTIVISKSGGTKETRNGMLEARQAYEKAGLAFESHVVAITGEGSELDKVAVQGNWLARFPMWDWIGGRTSETSAVGLLPALLQGINVDEFLEGAAQCDSVTRKTTVSQNPAALLALSWYSAGEGKGSKDMVILPYKDRLQLFSKYLQQLIMESLGKGRDVAGKEVNQGIAVYGNKGSTDQHAYIQQLRDGLNNFFVTFIEVRKDREGKSMMVEPNATSGDYLLGFYLGTREALFENNRQSLSLTIDEVSPRSVGVLIALYERAVGFYASLIGVNAYHQPGVEAGKKAATRVLKLQAQILEHLRKSKTPATADQIASALDSPQDIETVYKICEHMSANPDHNLKRHYSGHPFEASYGIVGLEA
jgi:glucose-6-phosphate isomerase